MKIGLYSVTYRGVWYRGEAVTFSALPAWPKNKVGKGWNSMQSGGMPPQWIVRAMTACDC